MKKIFILLVFPLLMATQCDDDYGVVDYRTNYSIQNNTTVDLIVLTDDNQQIVINKETSFVLSESVTDLDASILPTENNNLNAIELYILDSDDNLIIAYQQEPISNDLWIVSESENSSSYEYTLVITDDLLN